MPFFAGILLSGVCLYLAPVALSQNLWIGTLGMLLGVIFSLLTQETVRILLLILGLYLGRDTFAAAFCSGFLLYFCCGHIHPEERWPVPMWLLGLIGFLCGIFLFG